MEKTVQINSEVDFLAFVMFEMLLDNSSSKTNQVTQKNPTKSYL